MSAVECLEKRRSLQEERLSWRGWQLAIAPDYQKGPGGSFTAC